jgi:hypothetical protein
VKNPPFTDLFNPGVAIIYIFELINSRAMRKTEYYYHRHGEHHPRASFGIFFITLGLALLVATNDLLGLGSVKSYFTWETGIIFTGLLLLLNLHLVAGIVLIAIGSWFFLDQYMGEIPAIIQQIYWPSFLVLIGISFIISSFVKRVRKIS